MKKILLVVLVLALMMVGCSSEVDPLVGSWYDETTGQMLTFEEDGTFASGLLNGEYTTEEEILTMTIGDDSDVLEYDIDGDNLELRFPDADDFELYFTRIKKAK